MKSKNNDYRCSCCNEMKNKYNKTLRVWDEETIGGKKADDRVDVYICRKCNSEISRAGFFGVKQFKGY